MVEFVVRTLSFSVGLGVLLLTLWVLGYRVKMEKRAS